MDEIIRRFPGLGKKIIDQVEGKTLAKCREVNAKWKHFIDKEKTIWIRMIEKHADNVNISQNLKIGIIKTSTDTVMELAKAVNQFLKSNPIRVDEKWCPLQIVASHGYLRGHAATFLNICCTLFWVVIFSF